MSKPHETEKIQGSETAEAAQSPPPKKQGKIIGAAKWVLAINAWKKQAGILKKRASFPLLRHVIKNSATSNKIIIPTEIIDDEYIAKSIAGHRWIMWTMIAVGCYYLTVFAKGLALAIKFDDPWNTWLMASISMLLFTSFRAVLSRKVLKVFIAERDLRLGKFSDLPEGRAANEAG